MGFKKVTGVGWEGDNMSFNDIEPGILLQHNIPKPLHGVNPRSIMGNNWWNKERQLAYQSTDYHCIACGVHKNDALLHHWLEAHEIYTIDYEKGLVTFTRVVPLCPYCHKYIHNGLLYIHLVTNKISVDTFWDILKFGTNLLIEHNMTPNIFVLNLIKKLYLDCISMPIWASDIIKRYTIPKQNIRLPEWNTWRLSFNNTLYKPLYSSYEEWTNHFNKEE